jgi:predicted nucleic acid-binding protein
LTAVVVDASVAMKWFVPEELSAEAVRLLDGSLELIAPDLLWPEFGNTLWKKLMRAEIVATEAAEILAALGKVPLVVISSSLLLAAALEIAVATRRTVYDALYLAAAVSRDCPLVTADDRMVRALSGGPLAPHVHSLSRPL